MSRAVRGVEWEVHPHDPRHEPVVASGITDDADKARSHVEQVLEAEPGRARWGEIITGASGGEACLRHDDGLAWVPRYLAGAQVDPAAPSSRRDCGNSVQAE